jgi:uncharacterized protein (TIGR02453 family)
MAFTGFPIEGQGFFEQLALCQDREWFRAHKGDYEALWQEPFTALLGELQARLTPVFPHLKGATPKVFRIYRDVRFSKDKSPFKPSISGMLPLFGGGGPMEMTALYLDLGRKPFVAAGRWMMESALIKRYRATVADEKTGAPFAKAVNQALARGFTLASHDALKRPPPGIDAAHPRVELLKLKGFALTFPQLTPTQLVKGGPLLKRLTEQATQVAPLLRWVDALAHHQKPLPKPG